jgi:D-3-phosphoglycerate dehydrogenase / 2-oxoglutarate reductase
MKVLVVGDAMISGKDIGAAAEKYFRKYGATIEVMDWKTKDKVELQNRRINVEKNGPAAEAPPAGMLQKVADADILLVHYTPVARAVFEAAKRLKIAGTCRAGLENLDVQAATDHKVAAFNIMGRNAEAVSDFAMGLMLAEARNIARSHAALKQGKWLKDFSNVATIPNMREKTIGLVGFGYVGQLMAQKAKGFNMNVLVYDPYVPDEAIHQHGAKKESIENIFKVSDFVSIHARLTDATKGLINADLINSMKPTAYLINTARAGLIVHEALYKALKEKRISGAALDVFETEPLPGGHILMALDNVTITSHLAGTTVESLTDSPRLLVEDIDLLLSGKIPRWVKNTNVLTGFVPVEKW